MKSYIIAGILTGAFVGLIVTLIIVYSGTVEMHMEIQTLKKNNEELKIKLNEAQEERDHFFDKFIEEKSKTKVDDLGKFTVAHFNSDNNRMEGGPVAFTGVTLREGHIAVDPDVIPLGSIVYLVFVENGETIILKCTAVDIGDAIKGNHIDLFKDVPAAELERLGVKEARVYVEV